MSKKIRIGLMYFANVICGIILFFIIAILVFFGFPFTKEGWMIIFAYIPTWIPLLTINFGIIYFHRKKIYALKGIPLPKRKTWKEKKEELLIKVLDVKP